MPLMTSWGPIRSADLEGGFLKASTWMVGEKAPEASSKGRLGNLSSGTPVVNHRTALGH